MFMSTDRGVRKCSAHALQALRCFLGGDVELRDQVAFDLIEDRIGPQGFVHVLLGEPEEKVGELVGQQHARIQHDPDSRHVSARLREAVDGPICVVFGRFSGHRGEFCAPTVAELALVVKQVS